MHHAPVIPYQQLVWLPTMLVGEVRMNGKGVEFFDPRSAFFIRHAEDVFSVVPEEQTLSPGIRMGPDDRMVDWRCVAFLRFRHRFFTVAPGA